MNKAKQSESQKIAEVVKAFKNGSEIEYRVKNASEYHWRITKAPMWNWRDFDYRIKPKNP